jgi:hypothetical protein
MIYRLCVLSLLLFSCGQQTELSERFMNECDCIVYQDEIIKQHRKGYTIEYINPSKASGCVKNQLSHTYIIDFEDSLGVESVVVVCKTPEKYIQSIKGWALTYGSKNTRLSHVNEQKQRIQLILSKKYVKPSDTIFHNSYRPYKEILLKKEKSLWSEESSKINPYWPWQGNTPF